MACQCRLKSPVLVELGELKVLLEPVSVLKWCAFMRNLAFNSPSVQISKCLFIEIYANVMFPLVSEGELEEKRISVRKTNLVALKQTHDKTEDTDVMSINPCDFGWHNT